MHPHNKAREYLERALTIQIEIGDRDGEAKSYENLRTLFISLGEYEKAQLCLEKALAIQIEIGNRDRGAKMERQQPTGTSEYFSDRLGNMTGLEIHGESSRYPNRS